MIHRVRHEYVSVLISDDAVRFVCVGADDLRLDHLVRTVKASAPAPEAPPRPAAARAAVGRCLRGPYFCIRDSRRRSRSLRIDCSCRLKTKRRTHRRYLAFGETVEGRRRIQTLDGRVPVPVNVCGAPKAVLKIDRPFGPIEGLFRYRTYAWS